MRDDVTAGTLPDSRPIYRLIRRTRHLLRSSWVLTGAGLTAGLLLGTLAAVALIDMLAPIAPMPIRLGGRVIPGDSLVRLLGLLVIVVPAAWAFLAGVVRPLFRRLGSGQVARRIEKHLPGIHNRLVSCIDLESPDRKEKASSVFYRRLLTEALDRIRGFHPRKVLDLISLRHSVVFATGSTAALILVWYLFAGRMPTALARIFQPFADIPPASQVAFHVEPGDAPFLRDEPIPFAAEVTTANDPQGLRLELSGVGGAKHRFELIADRQDPKRWARIVDGASLGDGFENGFTYRVFGGGTWSKQHTVRMVDRPVLVNVANAVYYPAYMGISQAHLADPQAVEVKGPEAWVEKNDSGAVEMRVEARGDVARGEIQLLKAGIRIIPAKERSDKVWFEDRPPVGATTGGTWVTGLEHKRAFHTEPEAFGTHGHWFQDDPAGHVVSERAVLFTEVYLVPGHLPETIMLQWHDGEGWEHGAYWGADLIREGKANSASRRHVGELPAAGKWARLEVPAASVGLSGKTMHGVAFKLHGGQCYWGRSGTVQVEEPAVEVIGSYAMNRGADGRWVGRFPLIKGTGLFRAELKSADGHPNYPMKELKYVALPDLSPTVALTNHHSETVLSKAASLPLSIIAGDDYGLAEINLLFRHDPTGAWSRRTIRRFPRPQVNAQIDDASLTEAAKLPMGGRLHYAIEARDRKGQETRTREYVVRIATDPNAADQQLDTFEKTQDLFRARLIQLIAQQKKVKDNLEKLNKENAALNQKVEAAYKDRPEPTGKIDPKTGKPEPEQTVKLDPETARKLAALQNELAKLSKEEEQNARVAEQLDKDLARAAEDAGKLQMLPRPIVNEMKATQQVFQEQVANAMRDLSKRMNDSGNPKAGKSPDLKGLESKSDRLEKELESIKNRLEALAKARKGLNDLAETIKKLQRDMLTEKGKLTNRELEELRDFIAKMRDNLKDLQDKQEALEKEGSDSKDLKAVKEKQEDLNKRIEKMLADARHLLDNKKEKSRKPEFPDSPYNPDGSEKKVPPKEEDTNDPLPMKDKAGKTKPGDRTAKKPGDKDEEEKEPLFMPNLGGPKPKVDPRFAKKMRPVKRKPGENKDEKDEGGKDDLEDKQERNERDLQAAKDSLGSDKDSLDKIMQQLENALKNSQKGQKGAKGDQGKEGDDLAEQLAQMLQSKRLQEAMAMAARMRQGMPGKQSGQRPMPPSSANKGNMQGNPLPPGGLESELAKLDPGLRAKILQLPPSRFRDELIQGMSEQGPEAYRAFIQDYFKRLTETKETGKK